MYGLPLSLEWGNMKIEHYRLFCIECNKEALRVYDGKSLCEKHYKILKKKIGIYNLTNANNITVTAVR